MISAQDTSARAVSAARADERDLLRYALLGPVEVTVNGRLMDVQRPRQRAVLSYLLLNANKTVSVSELIEAMWGGAEPGTARTQVQSDISALRRAFKNEGIAIPVRTRAPGYFVASESGQLDIDFFKENFSNARREYERANIEASIEFIDSALGLWRGDPLSDLTASFVESAQLQLFEMRLSADELHAELNLMMGNYVAVVADVSPLVVKYPLHEELRRKLMLALFRSGRQADALWHARELRTALVEQQGLTPGRSFIEAEEAILRGDSSLDLLAPKQSVRLSPKPFSKPMQLPNEPSDFTGRAEYLRELGKLAFPAASLGNRAVLVALVGPAGVGKTALAVHWAHRNADRFPDGQLYINLRGYDSRRAVSSGEALSRMLRALGVGAEAIPSDLEDSANLFRSVVAGQRMLVVLDNALSADQLRPLLAASQDTVTLITSRSKLTGLAAREGARRLTLKPLAPGESMDLLGRLLGRESLRDEPEAVRQLTRVCNGLPLVLRIAAANIANQSSPRLADFVSELTSGDVLAALQVPEDEGTSVLSVFDQSYNRVSATTRRCLRLLSLIPGPDFTLDAVSVLTAADRHEARQLLYQLLEAHLVDQPVTGRYAMHDLLRSYARSKTEAEDSSQARAAARERLLSWYLRSADNATWQMFPHWIRLPIPDSVPDRHSIAFDSSSEAITWLDCEYPNLAAALREAADAPHIWLLADSLRGYFFVRRLVSDWIAATTAALAAATAHQHLHAELASRLSLAQAYQWSGDHPQALKEYESALRLARRTGKADAEVACQGNVGSILVEAGEPMRAIPHLREALDVAPDTLQDPNQLVTLSAIGTAYQHLGQLSVAVAIHRRALILARSISSVSGEAYATANLGTALHMIGSLDEARERVQDALVLLRQLGDRDVESACLSVIAEIYLDAGDAEQACDWAEQAWQLSCTVESPLWAIPVVSMHATVRCDLDEHERAIRLAQDKGAPEFIARTLLAAARTAAQVGAMEAGTANAHKALNIAVRMGYKVIEGNTLLALGELELAAGHRDVAVTCAQKALAIHKDTGHVLGETRASALLDRIDLLPPLHARHVHVSRPGPGCSSARSGRARRPHGRRLSAAARPRARRRARRRV
jgi:DNA-binding SARP family transcriptional activator/Tfp pilus assembly protein PilF